MPNTAKQLQFLKISNNLELKKKKKRTPINSIFGKKKKNLRKHIMPASKKREKEKKNKKTLCGVIRKLRLHRPIVKPARFTFITRENAQITH